MDLAFQELILKYFIHYHDDSELIKLSDSAIFENQVFETIHGLLIKYRKKYNQHPTKVEMLEYLNKIVSNSRQVVADDVISELRVAIKTLYMPFEKPSNFVKDTIKEYVLKVTYKRRYIERAKKLKDATEDDFGKWLMADQELWAAVNDSSYMHSRTGPMIASNDVGFSQVNAKGHPTNIQGINVQLNKRGFLTPELIGLCGAPKDFKTGILLSICVGYAKMGLDVFIADAENGDGELRDRVKQTLLQCRFEEIGGKSALLSRIYESIRQFNSSPYLNYSSDKKGFGDIVVRMFDGRRSTLADVDAELALTMKDNPNFVPKAIMYDYLQLFESTNVKNRGNFIEKNKDVYHHAVSLNRKYGTFAFTPIPVAKEAVEAKVINVKSAFANDFSQAFNCHSAWILCRTIEEKREKTGRLISAFQRAGRAYDQTPETTICLNINADKHIITELDPFAYLESFEAMFAESSKKGKYDLGKKRRITDD